MDGRVVATLCGVVERVNKLVYVRSLRARLVLLEMIITVFDSRFAV